MNWYKLYGSGDISKDEVRSIISSVPRDKHVAILVNLRKVSDAYEAEDADVSDDDIFADIVTDVYVDEESLKFVKNPYEFDVENYVSIIKAISSKSREPQKDAQDFEFVYIQGSDVSAVDDIVRNALAVQEKIVDYDLSHAEKHEDVDGWVLYDSGTDVAYPTINDFQDGADSGMIIKFEPILRERGSSGIKRAVQMYEWKLSLLAFESAAELKHFSRENSLIEKHIVGVRALGPKLVFKESCINALMQTIIKAQQLIGLEGRENRVSFGSSSRIIYVLSQKISKDRKYFQNFFISNRKSLSVRDENIVFKGLRQCDRDIDDIVDAFWAGEEDPLGIVRDTYNRNTYVFSPAGWVASARTRQPADMPR